MWTLLCACFLYIPAGLAYSVCGAVCLSCANYANIVQIYSNLSLGEKVKEMNTTFLKQSNFILQKEIEISQLTWFQSKEQTDIKCMPYVL